MTKGLSHPELRGEMVDAVELLFRAGVMPHSGHANFSCRLDGERMLLTSGVIVRDLRPEGLAVVTFEGQVEGDSDACAVDVVDMHATVYRARPAARSVLHTHSPAATAFAVANRTLPCRYETLYRFGGQVGEVPLARWSPERRDPAFLRSIAAAIHGQPGTRAVLLANHGLLAFAASPTAAALLVIALEEAAEAELAAAAIGGARDFPAPVGS
jgi:L-ribulose-5-phosphate 4-epimerase